MRQFNATRLVSILFLVSIITSCSPLAVTPQPTATVLPSPTASLAPAHMVEPAFTPSPAPANTDAPAQADQAGFPSVAKMKWFDRQHGWALIGQTDYQLVRTEDGGQTWQDVMPARDARLEFPYEGTFFLDARTAWVMLRVGGNGVTAQMLYRTTDAGQTWQSWPWTFPTNPASLTFFDENNGLAGADPRCSTTCDEALYRTSNGGKTWTLMQDVTNPLDTNPAPGRMLQGMGGIYFQNPTTFWVRPDASNLYVSRDAGKTWQQKQPQLPSARTFGGGRLFSLRPNYLPPLGGPQQASLPVFLNDRQGFFYVWLTEQELVVYMTTDGGDTWTPAPAHLNSQKMGAAADFVTVQDWFIQCGENLCGTHNGGQTWQVLPVHLGNGVRDMDFVDAADGWAAAYPDVGGDLILFRTQDGGHSWQRMQPRRSGAIAPTLAPYPTAPAAGIPQFTPTMQPTVMVTPGAFPLVNQFIFSDPQTAFGMIWPKSDQNYTPIPNTFRALRSIDGARTWHDVTPRSLVYGGVNAFLTGILNANMFWIVVHPPDQFGGKDTLYRTTDGGQTWTKIDAPFTMGGIRMLDEQNGWAIAGPGGCGAGSCWSQLFYTTDGGLTWTLYHPQPPLQVEPSFGEGTFGYSSGTTFQFTAPETIWMGGGFADYGPPQLLVSRDRGQTWQTIRFNLPESMRPVYLHLPTFFNKNDGFLSMTAALGKTPAPDGNDHQMLAIFATTDGGQSWTPLPALDTGSFTNSVQFATPTDWFADCNGALCRTNDGGQTWQALPYPEIRGGSFTLDHFFDAQNGVGIARFATPAYQDYQEIYMTHDGGQTWTRLQPVLR